MTILRIISSMDPITGGPCQGIRDLVPELEKLNLQNEVVCLDDPSAYFLKKDTFPIHALGKGKGPWHFNPKLIPWMIKNMSRYDIVIVHGLWQYSGYALRRALNILKKNKKEPVKKKLPRYFVMPHGMLDPYFQRASHRKLKAIRNWFYWKLIESKVVNKAEGVLFTCEAELLLAKDTFHPYKPKKEINVGYGVPEPPPYSDEMRNAFLEKCPKSSNNTYLLFLSRIHKKKGVDLLINAYIAIHKILTIEKSVDKQSINKLPIIVIAGPGADTKYGRKLTDLAKKHIELKDKILFPGMLTGNAKWGAFYGCEAFILTSHQENFGIAVAEALACSKPVLLSTEVNIWREIIACDAGLVARDTREDTNGLVNIWCRKTPEEKQRMAKEARICYEKNFEIKRAAMQFMKATGIYKR